MLGRELRQSVALAKIEKAEELAGAAVASDALGELEADLGGANDDMAAQAVPSDPPSCQMKRAEVRREQRRRRRHEPQRQGSAGKQLRELQRDREQHQQQGNRAPLQQQPKRRRPDTLLAVVVDPCLRRAQHTVGNQADYQPKGDVFQRPTHAVQLQTQRQGGNNHRRPE